MLEFVTRTGPLFQKLDRKRAYLEVAERIRDKIFADKLALFQRLPSERELAGQFGVSRVVVREAIRTLESSGLLTVKKGQKGGIFVAQDYERPIVASIINLLAGGEATLENLFEVRLLIEPYAAARVAEIGSEADFDRLEAETAAAEREYGAEQNIRHRYIDFHRQIIRLSRNPLLSIVGETVLLVVYDRVKPLVNAATTGTGLSMHKQLIAAFRRRDAAQAQAIMAKDIEILSRRFAKLSAKITQKTAPAQRARKVRGSRPTRR